MAEQKFEHQTAGHEGSLLKQGADRIMKPVSKNEISFYEGFYKKYSTIQEFAPKFFGTQKKDEKTYIVMEDLTAPFKKPCIMDIKMGISSVGEDATPEKRESMRKKDESTTTVSLGIRICGLRTYLPNKKEYIVKDKPWGKKVKENAMTESMGIFFNNGNLIRKEVVQAFLAKLKKIQEFFELQKNLRFYSSSLLFIYEGLDSEPVKVDVRMIDFAHVHEIHDGGRDDGYILGLKNLIKSFEGLVSK